jgi:hypothetical protein
MWGGFGEYERAAGRAGVILFGLVTCRLIWMLPADRGAVVIASRYGVRALRIGNEFLLRDSIEDVSVRETTGARPLTPTSALRRRLCCVRGKRTASPRIDADRIVIDPAGLATDFGKLLRARQAFHDASERRTALQQKSGHDAPGFAVEASQVCRRSTAMLRCRMDSYPVTPGCCGGATFAGN